MPVMSDTTIQPGRLTTDEVEISWDEETITLHRAPGLEGEAQAHEGVVELTRFRREQSLGFLGKLLGRPSRLEHHIRAELRFAGKHRLAFTARVDALEELEGLPERRAEPHPVPYPELRALLFAATTQGAEVAVGAHAYIPEEDAPHAAVSGSIPDTALDIDSEAELQRFLASPKPGHILKLAPGTYHLNSVFLNCGVQIHGAGMQDTLLRIDSGPSWGFLCSGEGSVVMRDLSLESAHVAAAGVLQVDDGVVTLIRVAVRAHPETSDAVGIQAKGRSRLHLEESRVERCHNGVVLTGASRSRIVSNTLCDCFVGIAFDDVAEGHLAGNTIRDNTTGVNLKGACTVLVHANSVIHNSGVGISVAAQARARLTLNLCEANGRGISIRCTYPAELEDNLCVSNDGAGIHLASSKKGVINRNTCRWNRHGIESTDADCDATLRNNRCLDNRRAGIRVGAGAPLHVVDNILSNNAIGALVEAVPGERSDWVGPTLERNRCEDNTEAGIRFDGAGIARNNLCRRNGDAGILVNTRLSVLLDQNEETP